MKGLQGIWKVDDGECPGVLFDFLSRVMLLYLGGETQRQLMSRQIIDESRALVRAGRLIEIPDSTYFAGMAVLEAQERSGRRGIECDTDAAVAEAKKNLEAHQNEFAKLMG